MEQISGPLYSPLLLRILVYTSPFFLAGVLLVIWRKLPWRKGLKITKWLAFLLLAACLGVILPMLVDIIAQVRLSLAPSDAFGSVEWIMRDVGGFWGYFQMGLYSMRVLVFLLLPAITITILYSLWSVWQQHRHLAK